VQKSYAFLMEALDHKQKLFVEARALGSVPVVAARVAGYDDPDKAAKDLERDSTVRMAVESAVRLESARRASTKDEVREMLRDAYRNAEQAGDQIRAAREIGLLDGHYEETKKKIEITGSIDVVRKQMTNAGEDDLMKLAAYEGEFEVLDFVEDDGAVPRLSS
jgi:hypothetical protein